MSAAGASRNAVAALPSHPPRQDRLPRARLGAAATLRFSWLDQMAPDIAGGELELIQAGPGNGGWLLPIVLGDVEVQVGRYGAMVLTRGTAAPSRVSVLIALGAPTPGLWEGCPSDPGVLLVYAPGAQQFASDGKGALWARLSVGAEHLERAFFAATGRELQLPHEGFRCLRPSRGSIERLKQRLRDLPGSIAAAAGPWEPSRRWHEKQLLIELCCALGSDVHASSRRARGIDPRRIVQAVEEHLERELQEPIYLADLAAVAEASERTVEYAFRRLLGLTPMRYVKLRRLARVHGALRDAAPGSTTVTRVALDWGFEHLSQFARDYRGVYGETPSATLRRTRPGHEPRRVSGD
jgi:AraC-like DNA-binding protein